MERKRCNKATRDHNAKALSDGHKNGLTVEWMSMMSGISESYAYREIKRINTLTPTNHEK